MTTVPSAASEGPNQPRPSAQKRQAILKGGHRGVSGKDYLASNMDEIAALAAVSKQTVYKNFQARSRCS
jgi:TetR/AcrR family transcriptional regulator, mexJK operon transcriptional repressor